MSKQRQIIFQSPSPFPHDGDAKIKGKVSANSAKINTISSNNIAAKSLVLCNDEDFKDNRSRLHVEGCISLSTVASAPTGRKGDNTYLYSLNGDLVYNHNNGSSIVLSNAITNLESSGKGNSLVTEDGRKLKSIIFRGGFVTSE